MISYDFQKDLRLCFSFHILFTNLHIFLCFRKMAEAEMSETMAHQQVFIFPTQEELENPISLKDVQHRIRDVIMVLSDFNNLRDPKR